MAASGVRPDEQKQHHTNALVTQSALTSTWIWRSRREEGRGGCNLVSDELGEKETAFPGAKARAVTRILPRRDSTLDEFPFLVAKDHLQGRNV